jgi:hypothetical protein
MLASVRRANRGMCTRPMQNQDPDVIARSRRVRALCLELGQLVEVSREQRRSIDELLGRLEAVMRRARLQRVAPDACRPSDQREVRAAWPE